MTKQQTDEIQSMLSLAMDIGKSMIMCGAEINRVEETITRICATYSMKRTEVFSIVSMMSVTAVDEQGNTYTQSRRVYSYSTNLGRLEKLNALSRKICENKCTINQARTELEEINKEKNKFHPTALFGSMIAAGAFTVFFGGSAADAFAAMLIAVLIYMMNTFIKTRSMNKLFYTALCSALSGTLAILFTKIGFGDNAKMIMIGDIMLIIPGLMLINSVREMLCGDVVSGLLRMTESIIIALAIACGFAVPILIFGKLGW
ncbi:MAG: threonine/serine exporter family protein [Acutalibacteraceae bacterium]